MSNLVITYMINYYHRTFYIEQTEKESFVIAQRKSILIQNVLGILVLMLQY